MTENFFNILLKCRNNTGLWKIIQNEGDNVLAFEIHGFSKSDRATIFEHKNNIYCLTRYDRVDIVEDYDDIVRIAWDWYVCYKERGYSVPEEFKKDFIRLGLIEVKIKTVEDIIIK